MAALIIHERGCAKSDMIPGECDCESGRFWFDPDPESQLTRQQVRKITGDYRFPGVVDSIYMTLGGSVRLVIESTSVDTKGMQHIFAPGQLEPVPYPGDE